MKKTIYAKIIRLVFTMVALMITFSVVAYATGGNGLQTNKIYTGTSKLISDAMTVITILCPTICGVAAVYFSIRRGMADEQDGKRWTNRITGAIICGVLGGLIAGIINLVASYY